MVDYKKDIKEIEDEIKKTKYNKATQGHIGKLKAKIAMLKGKEDQRTSQKTGSSSYGYTVRKSGDGTVLLLGFPSAGKSTLLNAITGAESEVGAYAFTTLSVVPGMLNYKQAKIQILDVPGIVSGAASGKGRGREVLTVIQNADLVLIVVDVTTPEHYPAILREVREANIRLNQRKPEVYIKKKGIGGINVGRTVKTEIDDNTIKEIMREFKFVNADILIRSPLTVDQFIDCIENNKKYVPAIICLTKGDMATPAELKKVKKQINADLILSAHENTGIDELKDMIFDKLDFMRVFMKEPRKDADLIEPMIITRGSTLKDICSKTHKDFIQKFRFARVWGKSAKFPGQQFQRLNHVLQDGDVVELHIR
ncbi:GTP-binding protein [Candidatus Woesearchaeota archaeon]|nr:GTP-binding protein [Candidatus Woesearchaeota archaeon]